MPVSVIMPCYNTDQEIHQMTQMAIESIREAGEVELIIIDNASTFAPAYLRDIADVYVRNQKNIGYPGAVNQGIALATNDILCISNNDIRVPKNIFSTGLEALRDPKIGSAHFRMISYNQEFNPGNKIWLSGKERWCTASFFLIKREAIPKGNYDLGYGAGGYDDWDFFHRMRHINGWITVYINQAEYQHYGSWTLSKVPESEKGKKNRKYFKDKHGAYAEDIWSELYPDQMSANYQEGFE